MTMRRYRYRLYPSSKQKIKLINSFKTCKTIYNQLLENSIETYKSTGKTLRKFDYNKQLTGQFSEIHSQVKQNVSDRVHKAFSNFFRRVKDPKEKRKGFPRFKSIVKSITYPQSGFKFINNRRLQVSKIGSIPIVLHRVPKGTIKTLTIKCNRARQWFASFACEVEKSGESHKFPKNSIGIDMGLETFATLSNAEQIDNPRWFRKSEHRLKQLQRQLSRKKIGSNNRRKHKFKLAKAHLKVSNQRDDFLHKESRKLAQRFGKIAFEKLNIKNMVKNHYLAKSINDAGWNKFIQFTTYKAVTCGGSVELVDARNTTKTCSKCGTKIDIPLSKREFLCPNCGFVCHRDVNAAINIHDRVGHARIDACGHDVRPSLGKAVVDEAGTIHRTTHGQ